MTADPQARPTVLRQHAETQFAEELAELAKADDRQRPPNWKLSPWAVRTYLLGGTLANGFEVTPKYIGNGAADRDRRRDAGHRPRAAALWACRARPRAGCRSTWPRRSAGDSTLLVQGTAGTDEAAIRYGWNYARLLAEGPSLDALVASPMMRAMREGKIARVEELTRIPADVQDTLITILSEKTLPIPELDDRGAGAQGLQRHRHRQQPRQGRQRAVQRAACAASTRSSCRCRTRSTRRSRSSSGASPQLGRALELPAEQPALEEIRRVVTIFRELRDGVTADGKTKLKSPSGTLSTAEAISVINAGLAMAAYFGDGALRAADIAAGLTGAVVKDPVQDRVVWLEYLETVVKERDGWKDLYRACHEVL